MNDTAATAHQEAAIAAIRELLEIHFREAENSADEDGKFSISFRASLDRSHPQTILKVTSRISKSVTDEIETNVSDPSQPELGLAHQQ